MSNNPEGESKQIIQFPNPSTEPRLPWTKRVKSLISDPDSKEFIGALYRTSINIFISMADIGIGTLYIGEAASILADSLKTARRVIRLTGIDPKFLDLTPNVDLVTAWASELLEIPTVGHAPTHAVESFIQFYFHDRFKLARGRQKVWGYVRGTLPKYVKPLPPLPPADIMAEYESSKISDIIPIPNPSFLG